MDQFFERYDLIGWTQEEIDNSNKPIVIKEIEAVRNYPQIQNNWVQTVSLW